MLHISPLPSPIRASIKVPGSKSLTNRALLITALADGISILENALECDDTNYMKNALKSLGIKIKTKNTRWEITGRGGQFEKPKNYVFLGNSAAALRFLTAAITLTEFETTLTGNKRMCERPIHDLIDSLEQLGGNVVSMKNNGCPPVKIRGEKLFGGTTALQGNTSSQYLSALLMIAPYAKHDVTIKVTGKLVSKPYIEMTLQIMKDFGIKIKHQNYKIFRIKAGQKYKARTYAIEGDASSAAYFFALAAITESEITTTNLPASSSQADIHILKIVEKMGCNIQKREKNITVKGIANLKPLNKINLNHIPDGAMSVAIMCAFAKGTSHIIGLETLRVKECDRLDALSRELNKLCCMTKATKDGLIINGDREKLHYAEIETYNDHRMAMCFAIAALGIKDGLTIKNPSCVNKTYPDFWQDLKQITQMSS